jgi:hypothetical protein
MVCKRTMFPDLFLRIHIINGNTNVTTRIMFLDNNRLHKRGGGLNQTYESAMKRKTSSKNMSKHILSICSWKYIGLRYLIPRVLFSTRPNRVRTRSPCSRVRSLELPVFPLFRVSAGSVRVSTPLVLRVFFSPPCRQRHTRDR